MDKIIRIRIDDRKFEARLNDTQVAGMIWEALPITTSFNYWVEVIGRVEDYQGFKGIKGTERIILERA